MAKTEPFEQYTNRYEDWFDTYEAAYESEIAALERLVPRSGEGVEIGVGTGQFAAPLGIETGLDPTDAMLARARERGIKAVKGVAEALPFRDGTFDVAMLVTTICFVDDIPQTLAEARRVLDPDGSLVMGYIDKNSPVGEIYQEKQAENPFYQDAVFVSTEELLDALEAAGFSEFEFVQTIYEWPGDIDEPEPVEEGYGDGSFVAIEAR
jgi:ubiquinone/menaquinone biosynthesis C-methylase UbiE